MPSTVNARSSEMELERLAPATTGGSAPSAPAATTTSAPSAPSAPVATTSSGSAPSAPAATTRSGSAPAATTTSGSDAGDNQAQDDSKPILIGTVAAVVAGSFTLLTNPPKSVHNLLILYNIYSLFLLVSFVLSICSLLFILTTPSLRGTAWVRNKALQIAIVSLVISVILRIFLQLPAPIKWYYVLVPVLSVGGISIYLLLGWIKTNDSGQTSSRCALTSSYNEV